MWQQLLYPQHARFLQKLGQNLGVLCYESDIQEVSAKSTMLTSSYFTWELSNAFAFLRSKERAWFFADLYKVPHQIQVPKQEAQDAES